MNRFVLRFLMIAIVAILFAAGCKKLNAPKQVDSRIKSGEAVAREIEEIEGFSNLASRCLENLSALSLSRNSLYAGGLLYILQNEQNLARAYVSHKASDPNNLEESTILVDRGLGFNLERYKAVIGKCDEAVREYAHKSPDVEYFPLEDVGKWKSFTPTTLEEEMASSGMSLDELESLSEDQRLQYIEQTMLPNQQYSSFMAAAEEIYRAQVSPTMSEEQARASFLADLESMVAGSCRDNCTVLGSIANTVYHDVNIDGVFPVIDSQSETFSLSEEQGLRAPNGSQMSKPFAEVVVPGRYRDRISDEGSIKCWSQGAKVSNVPSTIQKIIDRVTGDKLLDSYRRAIFHSSLKYIITQAALAKAASDAGSKHFISSLEETIGETFSQKKCNLGYQVKAGRAAKTVGKYREDFPDLQSELQQLKELGEIASIGYHENPEGSQVLPQVNFAALELGSHRSSGGNSLFDFSSDTNLSKIMFDTICGLREINTPFDEATDPQAVDNGVSHEKNIEVLAREVDFAAIALQDSEAIERYGEDNIQAGFCEKEAIDHREYSRTAAQLNHLGAHFRFVDVLSIAVGFIPIPYVAQGVSVGIDITAAMIRTNNAFMKYKMKQLLYNLSSDGDRERSRVAMVRAEQTFRAIELEAYMIAGMSAGMAIAGPIMFKGAMKLAKFAFINYLTRTVFKHGWNLFKKARLRVRGDPSKINPELAKEMANLVSGFFFRYEALPEVRHARINQTKPKGEMSDPELLTDLQRFSSFISDMMQYMPSSKSSRFFKRLFLGPKATEKGVTADFLIDMLAEVSPDENAFKQLQDAIEHDNLRFGSISDRFRWFMTRLFKEGSPARQNVLCACGGC